MHRHITGDLSHSGTLNSLLTGELTLHCMLCPPVVVIDIVTCTWFHQLTTVYNPTTLISYSSVVLVLCFLSDPFRQYQLFWPLITSAGRVLEDGPNVLWGLHFAAVYPCAGVSLCSIYPHIVFIHEESALWPSHVDNQPTIIALRLLGFSPAWF